MTIGGAIARVDNLKYNTYTNADKIAWLSKLDNMIKRNIIDTHDGADQIIFDGYTEDTDPDTELLASEPYDAMYLRWLEAQIDYTNGEYDKYNASILLFNTEYEAFNAFYTRTHMPKCAGRRFRF